MALLPLLYALFFVYEIEKIIDRKTIDFFRFSKKLLCHK